MEEQRDYDEINLMDYVRVIPKHKWLIVTIVTLAVLGTAAVSLVMTPIYEAKAVIAPVSPAQDPGGMSSIAMQLGIAMPSSSQASEIMNLLRSSIIRENLIRKHDLLAVLFREEVLKGRSEDQKVWEGIRYLQSSLKVGLRPKDNAIDVAMQFHDPKIAADIVRYTLTELNEHMSQEAKRVADTNRKYLESQIDRTADPFIRTRIYTLIASQIERSMMAEVKENFAFKIVDPPKIPDTRISPKRTRMVLLSFVASLLLAIVSAFMKEAWDKDKAGRQASGGQSDARRASA